VCGIGSGHRRDHKPYCIGLFIYMPSLLFSGYIVRVGFGSATNKTLYPCNCNIWNSNKTRVLAGRPALCTLYSIGVRCQFLILGFREGQVFYYPRVVIWICSNAQSTLMNNKLHCSVICMNLGWELFHHVLNTLNVEMGRFLGIIGWYFSVSKCNRLHVNIFRFFPY
jgi:hypothetical protein